MDELLAGTLASLACVVLGLLCPDVLCAHTSLAQKEHTLGTGGLPASCRPPVEQVHPSRVDIIYELDLPTHIDPLRVWSEYRGWW